MQGRKLVEIIFCLVFLKISIYREYEKNKKVRDFVFKKKSLFCACFLKHDRKSTFEIKSYCLFLYNPLKGHILLYNYVTNN